MEPFIRPWRLRFFGHADGGAKGEDDPKQIEGGDQLRQKQNEIDKLKGV